MNPKTHRWGKRINPAAAATLDCHTSPTSRGTPWRCWSFRPAGKKRFRREEE